LRFGNFPVVVLNDYKLIREAYAENVFAGRPQTNFIKERNFGGNRGVLFADGKVWSEQRRFALKNLRDFGFGKKSMETAIMEEVKELISNFRKETGKPISSQNRFNVAVLNALWSILTGERHSHDDPRLNKLIKTLTAALTHRPLSVTLAEFFPIVHLVRKALPFLFDNSGREFREGTYGLIGEVIKQHEETLQEDSPRDFVDVYLTEMRKTTDVHSTFYKEEGQKQLRVLMLDMFAAGAETTSTTLTYSFLLLALYPEVQEKLFEEIKRVVGLSRHVALADRPEMPFFEATIMEIQRYASLVPVTSHVVHEDVEFHGYTIGKGTIVTANLYSAMRDVKAWGDPDNFRPERFLSPDGKTIVRNEAFMPFAVGKRVCLGETLAKDELFLFMGNLFQAFQVKTVDGEPKPKFETFVSIVLVPKPHRLVLVERQST
jgi:cytochrome P450